MIFFRARFPNLHQKRLDLSNVSTRSVTTVTEEDINHIAQANKLDLEIYGYAVQQLTRLVSENRSA